MPVYPTGGGTFLPRNLKAILTFVISLSINTDEEAASYLSGTKNKEPLTESPFVRYLNYGAGKDGYWTYRHMVLQIEDCVDCLKFLYPRFQY